MTAQSSSSSLFGTYLKYRLRSMGETLIMCCILNVLALPLYAVAANVGFGGIISDFAIFGRVFSTACIISLPAIAIFNAVHSFEHYHKKNLTDTFGSLPLSYRERFGADLLAGYIISAAPIIPCGIFCAVIFSGMQPKYEDLYGITDGVCNFRMSSVGISIAVSLFLIVSFAYLFSVLISTCCGKLFHSVIYSVFGIAVLPLFFGGISRCFANGVVGLDGKAHFAKAASFFPPIGLIGELFDAMGVAFDYNGFIDPLSRAEELYSVFDPIHIVFFVILAAGLIAGAYFIGKRRLAENTGSAFAVKPMFVVLSVGATAAVTITMLAMTYHTFSLYLVISAVIGLVTCFVTILLYLPKKRELLRSIISGAVSIAAMLAAEILLNKTGSFGTRYFPESSEKIEYVRIDDTYTITDKADIAKYTSLLNDKLREIPFDLYYENNGYHIEVRTTGGRTIERRYYNYRFSEWETPFLNSVKRNAPRLQKLLGELDGYVDYFFDELDSVSDDWACQLRTNNTSVKIPKDRTKELITILRDEAAEKHRPGANIYADIIFTSQNITRTFEIEEDFVNTIMFLEIVDENVEKDPESTYLSIAYNIVDNETGGRFSITVPYKNRDNEKVKELVSLLEEGNGKDADTKFKIMSYYISGEQYVSEKNTNRVLELMAEIAADSITSDG